MPDADKGAIRPWPTKASRYAGQFPFFRVRADVRTSPRTQCDHEFYVIECSDWVNVIAITAQEELIMVKQFRHGSESIELEIPGGVMDATDTSPVATGIRELREETGFEGRNARLIGGVYPNPAIMNNTCRTVLIEDCERRHEQALDQGEDIAVELIPLDQVRSAVASGEVSHALVIVALYYYDMARDGRVREV